MIRLYESLRNFVGVPQVVFDSGFLKFFFNDGLFLDHGVLEFFFGFCFCGQFCVVVWVDGFYDAGVTVDVVDFAVFPVFILALLLNRNHLIINRFIDPKYSKLRVVIHNSISVIQVSVPPPHLRLDLYSLLIKYRFGVVISHESLQL